MTISARLLEQQIYTTEQIKVVIHADDSQVYSNEYIITFPVPLLDHCCVEDFTARIRQIIKDTSFTVVNPVGNERRISQQQRLGALREYYKAKAVERKIPTSWKPGIRGVVRRKALA